MSPSPASSALPGLDWAAEGPGLVQLIALHGKPGGRGLDDFAYFLWQTTAPF